MNNVPHTNSPKSNSNNTITTTTLERNGINGNFIFQSTTTTMTTIFNENVDEDMNINEKSNELAERKKKVSFSYPMFFVVGYVNGPFVGNGQKSCRFKIEKKPTRVWPEKLSREIRDEDEKRNNLIYHLTEIAIVTGEFQFNLPHYNPFIRYQLHVRQKLGSTVFEVFKVLHTELRKTGTTVEDIKEYFISVTPSIDVSLLDRQLEIFKDKKQNLALTKKNVSLLVNDDAWRYRLISILEIFECPDSYFFLLRFFSSTFLNKLNKCQLDYLQENIRLNPVAFCFRGVFEQIISHPLSPFVNWELKKEYEEESIHKILESLSYTSPKPSDSCISKWYVEPTYSYCRTDLDKKGEISFRNRLLWLRNDGNDNDEIEIDSDSMFSTPEFQPCYFNPRHCLVPLQIALDLCKEIEEMNQQQRQQQHQQQEQQEIFIFDNTKRENDNNNYIKKILNIPKKTWQNALLVYVEMESLSNSIGSSVVETPNSKLLTLDPIIKKILVNDFRLIFQPKPKSFPTYIMDQMENLSEMLLAKIFKLYVGQKNRIHTFVSEWYNEKYCQQLADWISANKLLSHSTLFYTHSYTWKNYLNEKCRNNDFVPNFASIEKYSFIPNDLLLQRLQKIEKWILLKNSVKAPSSPSSHRILIEHAHKFSTKHLIQLLLSITEHIENEQMKPYEDISLELFFIGDSEDLPAYHGLGTGDIWNQMCKLVAPKSLNFVAGVNPSLIKIKESFQKTDPPNSQILHIESYQTKTKLAKKILSRKREWSSPRQRTKLKLLQQQLERETQEKTKSDVTTNSKKKPSTSKNADSTNHTTESIPISPKGPKKRGRKSKIVIEEEENIRKKIQEKEKLGIVTSEDGKENEQDVPITIFSSPLFNTNKHAKNMTSEEEEKEQEDNDDERQQGLFENEKNGEHTKFYTKKVPAKKNTKK